MMRVFRTIMPLLPAALAVLSVIDAFTAFQGDRIGRGAFKVFSSLMWLFIAYMLYATNKRIPTDDK